ncbi:MAG: undecaprenyldiphospho-muramoylpentapeptide beta-N-acetylglucosaminyltransferase [Longimicrobiales bacterium]
MHERPVVVFSGGGTGGHLYPALALADAVRRERPEVRAVFVGALRGVEARILPARGEEHHLLPVEGLSRRTLGGAIHTGRALLRSLARIDGLFRTLRPEAVVVTGGYAGGPAGIMAGFMGIPLVLQEQNAFPGKTTRLLSLWARRVHTAFPDAAAHLPRTARKRTAVSGNPVRPPSGLPPVEARRVLGLDPTGPVLLVMGGSQGSYALNQVVSQALASVARGESTRPEGLQVYWSTGPAHFDHVTAALAAAGRPAWVHARAYIDDMATALAAADFALSRGGAMTTAELLLEGVPSILVPLPTAAADHQSHNARALEKAGAAVVAPEADLTGASLWDHIQALAVDGDLRRRMSAAARAQSRPDAAGTIARDVLRVIDGGRS